MPRRDIEIIRDGLGIPHVRAGSVQDAFFGQGYVHAKDRLWQMTYDRYRAGGRAAKLLGRRFLTYDIFMRRLGLEESARADHETFNDETKGVLEAYADGVNAFLATDPGLPLEMRLLGIEPEAWEPWVCGAVLKVRHVLMGTFDNKLWRERLAQALGPRGPIVPGSPHEREDTLIVPVGATETWRADALATAGLPDGSNNWAVHGSRTASGKPLVAGDPHRTLEVPNVYYQNHIACPEFDAIGFSMAGVPGMFHFGHNAEVAWCVTHAMADTQDLYVEHFDDDGRYEFRGEWHESQRRTETIKVRDEDPVEIDVTVTAHGPVVIGDPKTGTAMALRWTGIDRPNPSLQTILPTLRAKTVDELDDVMRDWVDPCNNFVMADVHGTIGYLYRGRIPIRPAANGLTPVPGWTGEHEWDGDAPYEELPRLRNPEPGYIATANNRVCSMDYPYYLAIDYGAPFRVRRVIARVDELERATADDMSAVHADRTSLASAASVARIARIDGLDGNAAAAQRLVSDWDGTMDPESGGAAIYAGFRSLLADVVLETTYPDLRENPYGDEPFPTPPHTRIRTALPRLIGDVDDGLIREAFLRAVAQLEETMGPDPTAWRWSRLHVTGTKHPLSRIFPEHSDTLDPPVVSTGGDGECVQASSSELGLWVQHTSVARYVFDLGDWDNSRWVVPLGSSGDPSSPHYADQAQTWADVELVPMLYSWDRIEAETARRETLD